MHASERGSQNVNGNKVTVMKKILQITRILNLCYINVSHAVTRTIIYVTENNWRMFC